MEQIVLDNRSGLIIEPVGIGKLEFTTCQHLSYNIPNLHFLIYKQINPKCYEEGLHSSLCLEIGAEYSNYPIQNSIDDCIKEGVLDFIYYNLLTHGNPSFLQDHVTCTDYGSYWVAYRMMSFYRCNNKLVLNTDIMKMINEQEYMNNYKEIFSYKFSCWISIN